MKLSNRVEAIAESKSIGLAAQVETLKAQGHKIISLNIGEADFPTPKEIIDKTKGALEQNQTRYSSVLGIIKLREALAEKNNQQENTKLTAQNIIIGHGSKGLLYTLFQTLCNPGDEFIVIKPYWVTFPESIRLAGARPIFVDSKDDFQLDLQKIKAAIGPKTKGILINSPNNPTGAVYAAEDIDELIQVALHHKLYLVSDEAYKDLVYDKLKMQSLVARHPQIVPNLISVQTFSKSFFMTGFRIGHLIAHPQIIQGMNKLGGHLTGNIATFTQYGALAATEIPQSFLDEKYREFEKRRDLTYQLCSSFLPSNKPQGAFYFFPNIEKYLNAEINDCQKLAQYILAKAYVAVLPGEAFGMPGHLRISFASSEQEITQGLAQMKKALLEL